MWRNQHVSNTSHSPQLAKEIDASRPLLFDGPIKAPQPSPERYKGRSTPKGPRAASFSGTPQQSNKDGTLPGLARDANEVQRAMSQERSANGTALGSARSFAAPPSRGQRAATARARRHQPDRALPSPTKRDRTASARSTSGLGAQYGTFRRYTGNAERSEEHKQSDKSFVSYDPAQQQMIYAPPSARKRLERSRSAWLARTAIAGSHCVPPMWGWAAPTRDGGVALGEGCALRTYPGFG